MNSGNAVNADDWCARLVLCAPASARPVGFVFVDDSGERAEGFIDFDRGRKSSWDAWLKD